MTPDELLQALAEGGIEASTVFHPPVFTVAESRALRGELPGAHSKNLFLRAAKGEGFFLAVLEEHRQVSVNALARAAGWPRVQMASAEDLQAMLGVAPGSVTPFGLVHAAPGTVRLVLDAALALAPGLAWFHPLVNTASTGLRPTDLLRFLAGRGHLAQVLEFPEAPLA